MYQKRMERKQGLLRKRGRPAMLGKVATGYDHECSVYPDWIRVSFADGRTVVYDQRVTLPAPLVTRCVEIMESWKMEISVGEES